MSLLKFLKQVGVDYESLPQLKRMKADEDANMQITVDELTHSMMKCENGIVVAVQGISPIPNTLFKGNPKINTIRGVIRIYDVDQPKSFLLTKCTPDMIRKAYDYVHNSTNHVGPTIQVCPQCEYVNDSASTVLLERLFKGTCKLFKISL
jgi:hypothetical protein